jgi:hypothetical protein
MFFNWIPRNVWTSVWQAASGVILSYNTLLDLFDRIGNFLKRLDIYIGVPPTQMMTDVIVKIMTEILSVLGLATKRIQQGRICKCAGAYSSPMAQCVIVIFIKKLAGENDVEAAFQRLDQLIQEAVRAVGAQTLGVAHRIHSDLRVVMEGVWCLFCSR